MHAPLEWFQGHLCVGRNRRLENIALAADWSGSDGLAWSRSWRFESSAPTIYQCVELQAAPRHQTNLAVHTYSVSSSTCPL